MAKTQPKLFIVFKILNILPHFRDIADFLLKTGAVLALARLGGQWGATILAGGSGATICS